MKQGVVVDPGAYYPPLFWSIRPPYRTILTPSREYAGMPFWHMLTPWVRIRVTCCSLVDFLSGVRMAGRSIPSNMYTQVIQLFRQWVGDKGALRAGYSRMHPSRRRPILRTLSGRRTDVVAS